MNRNSAFTEIPTWFRSPVTTLGHRSQVRKFHTTDRVTSHSRAAPRAQPFIHTKAETIRPPHSFRQQGALHTQQTAIPHAHKNTHPLPRGPSSLSHNTSTSAGKLLCIVAQPESLLQRPPLFRPQHILHRTKSQKAKPPTRSLPSEVMSYGRFLGGAALLCVSQRALRVSACSARLCVLCASVREGRL